MAIGGVFHCWSAGITLREELAIFGFNGLELGNALPLVLSTVRSNRFLIGKIAVERILENLSYRPGRSVVDAGYDIVPGETA